MNSDPTHFDGSLHQGTVFKKTLGSYYVRYNEQIILCSISNKLRKRLIYPTADPASLRQVVVAVKDIEAVDPIAVGDRVAFIGSDPGSGVIVEVLPRRNSLTRRAPGKKPLEQVIVANADQIIPIFAVAQPEPKWNLLDRYLVTAEAADIPALICITKMDLDGDGRLTPELDYYQKIGYPLILTSARSGVGITALRQALQDRVSVFIGKSGVGKTSLLNAIEPGLGLRVNEISRSTGKGVHTTTHLEMFPLHFGGSVVDTPGMREFSIEDLQGEDPALFFPEMRSLLGRCRFGLDCEHVHEPGCAILEAVKAGEVSQRRYQSYLKIREEG